MATTQTWFTYIIATDDQQLYTGITTDMHKRWFAHMRGTGARYFRGRKPLLLCYLELHQNRSQASQREAFIKSLKRVEKILLIDQSQNQTLSLAQVTGLPLYDFKTSLLSNL